HLDGRAGRFGCLEGFHDEVELEAPAETAAEIGRVHRDFLGCNPADLPADHLHARLELRRRPDVHAVGTHVRGAIHRLHRGVREERHFVHGLDALCCSGERRNRVTVVASDGAVLRGALGEQDRDARAGDLRNRALIPGDLQSIATQLRRPIAIADHGDATRDLHDVPDTGDGFRGGRIKAADLAAEHRAACHYRGQPSWHADIDDDMSHDYHTEERYEVTCRRYSEHCSL